MQSLWSKKPLWNNITVKEDLIESTLSNMVPSLYSFAYALLCDSKASEAIVYDVFFLSKKNKTVITYFQELDQLTDLALILEQTVKIKIELLKVLYCMFEKRPSHASYIQDATQKYSAFFSLELKERAIIYLKYREHLDHDDLSSIFDKSSSEIITELVIAKNQLSEVVSL